MVKTVRRLATALAATVLVLGFTPAVSEATPAYASRIVSRHSGKCMEVDHGSLDSGRRVLQWHCHGGQHQLWRAVDMKTGYVQLRVEHSDKCLEVDHGYLHAGAAVLQWDCHGGTHQQWQQIPLGDGSYAYRARHSGRCLEIEGAGLDAGAWLLQWECHYHQHQRWAFG
ncbi:hypothetical protein GCM10022243_31260 [Saccharothrix violaceirubra]|uniref:Ricin B lectin domain-containing protein n=1 Tax=Saccharothrix violaceirubra TaxID=413306 RepID=A0A7W7WX45_9PSEU|nr:RICIN domain-containing protein [Saccharothrix violaceirubra]MBB4966751.1 hypothetical protein [Saccharothrix violaceirubra]